MVKRLGLGKNNHLTYASLALNPRYVKHTEILVNYFFVVVVDVVLLVCFFSFFFFVVVVFVFFVCCCFFRKKELTFYSNL